VISYNPPGFGCFKQRKEGWQGIKEGRALLQNHAAMYTGDDGPGCDERDSVSTLSRKGKGGSFESLTTPLAPSFDPLSHTAIHTNTEDRQRMGFRKE